MTITLTEQIACAKREIGMRERVYPRWVEQGRMTPVKAAREIEAMKAILDTLERLELAESPELAL